MERNKEIATSASESDFYEEDTDAESENGQELLLEEIKNDKMHVYDYIPDKLYLVECHTMLGTINFSLVNNYMDVDLRQYNLQIPDKIIDEISDAVNYIRGYMGREKKEEIKVDKITGRNYVGYVMTIPDASKVNLVDGRKSNRGTKLSEIVKNNRAIAGINAGGFADDGGVGSGNVLCDATIINKKLLYGNKTSKYSLIGLSSDKKLVLGKYTYQQAMNAGIESAVEFGPYLIVNGKNQITNASSGGIHPRMGIGQKKDGTFIFVVVDGRQPGYSIGTNLLEMQNIFNRYDAYNAANLDGGSSATMYYNGKVVNKTSTPMGERYLPNAFIVKE